MGIVCLQRDRDVAPIKIDALSVLPEEKLLEDADPEKMDDTLRLPTE